VRRQRGSLLWAFRSAAHSEGDDEFAETMDETPHANAINRLAWEIKHRTQSAERRRGDLSRLTHPNRAEQGGRAP
jgi:hypothetical protein